MTVSIHHIRHATSILVINGKRILIDPMLSKAGGLSPVPLTRNYVRNPLVEMTVPLSVFQDIDAILLTHRHFDHWDKKALSVLDKGLPVLCQPKDQASVLSAGFSRALPVDESLEWEGISIKRIQGIHAYGLTGKLLGPVSGFILDSAQQGSVYIVGDCMLTPAIEEAFRKYAPDIAIVNTGEAQMIWGAVITMTREDVLRLARLSPKTKLAAVHMDAINHCKLSRRELEVYLREQHCDGAVWIPEDGEVRIF
ncbi:MBL fold metallo-hydrolase [Paenibacillus oryzae]|uniref:MBL fold metallo-hydrolase n=1 Tax=Paenibacillus oryzae TaxID=1844972 RepID=A0A1A5YC40_9BACL|nr:MBL fold metallo-hydrolase [Paenibacillus oryzae]